MIKIIPRILVRVLLLALLVSACSGIAPAPTSTPPPPLSPSPSPLVPTPEHTAAVPSPSPTPSAAARAAALLTQMTVAEKIGQMTQVEKNSIGPQEVTSRFIGSVLSGGGGYPQPNTAAAWLKMTNDFQAAALQTRLGIPLLYGTDAVHGHGNLVGATIFPRRH